MRSIASFSRRRLLAACLPAGWPCGGWAAERASRPLRFAPVNQYGIALTASYWNPIVAYVSERSGIALELRLGRTSAETTAEVLAGDVDLVFSNHLFSPERAKLGWRVFGRRDTPPIQGELVVLEDSPIRDLAALANENVVFPGPEATVAYKFPYAHLLAQRIPVRVSFAGNSDAALAQLVSGTARAAGANSQVAAGWEIRKLRKLRVLWTSPAVYELALMASRRLAAATVAVVQEAFCTMHANPEGLKTLARVNALVGLPGDTHFARADDADYQAYRDFYRTAPPELR